ncbi:ER membrane protein complex subunit 10 [Cynara cardunculus var. scolymus]|uniref:ER membrane protein complex subunit 10 n=1 Tax=Cynara cardunculus var. scolymus TaxID=59895 RepID=UPI000D62ED10|nr:ER membrane protein complex subunit 10 [Cynara cardunculus var. scolymus]XP_024970235.1 ER membrane protein complex subunit 10 [Cynara cardunculus var. scolymus]
MTLTRSLMLLLLLVSSNSAFQSDELLVDDEEFGLEGGRSPNIDLTLSSSPPIPSRVHSPPKSTRKRSVDSESDSRVQFVLEHALGVSSEFSAAGTFTARLKASANGGQILTKLRFSRNDLTATEKEKFKKLLEDDDFYRIRLPSDVLNASGRDYVISSVKARCLPKDGLEEHILIHMEGVNILAVSYGSHGACQHPRQLRLPSKWSFNSHTLLKYSEQAPRTPTFSEDIGGVEIGDEEGVKPLERSFWAKYWMYLIPLGLIVMNAVTQAMNMPEEQASGAAGAQPQQAVAAGPRGQSAAVRRR